MRSEQGGERESINSPMLRTDLSFADNKLSELKSNECATATKTKKGYNYRWYAA